MCDNNKKNSRHIAASAIIINIIIIFHFLKLNVHVVNLFLRSIFELRTLSALRFVEMHKLVI